MAYILTVALIHPNRLRFRFPCTWISTKTCKDWEKYKHKTWPITKATPVHQNHIISFGIICTIIATIIHSLCVKKFLTSKSPLLVQKLMSLKLHSIAMHLCESEGVCVKGQGMRLRGCSNKDKRDWLPSIHMWLYFRNINYLMLMIRAYRAYRALSTKCLSNRHLVAL